MTKQFMIKKLMPVWLAVSAVIIAAGIVLYALFGFNYAGSEKKTFEVTYSSIVAFNEKEEDLAKICEDAFTANGLKYSMKETSEELSSNNFSETGDKVLMYTFSAKASNEKLAAACKAVTEKLAADAVYSDTYADYHTAQSEVFYEYAWRGAIGLAVGVIVALVYVTFRFGLSCALTGLVGCVHDCALTLALLAITRIPVYAYTPILFAAMAALLSVLLWLVQSVKLREAFKTPNALSAEDVVQEVYQTSYKTGLCLSSILATVLVVIGAVATNGVRLFMLPALLPVAVCTYSSLVLCISVFTPIKERFLRKANSKQKRYEAKQKADKQ